MNKIDKPSNRKTLTALSSDRYYDGSVTSPSFDRLMYSDNIISLRPSYIQKNKTHPVTLSGFPLLRKEPYSDANSFDKIKKQSKIIPFKQRSIYAKPPPLLYTSDPDQNSFIFYLAGSLITHSLIALAIYFAYLKFPSQPINGNSDQGQPVDVVFSPTSTGSSGLAGDGLNGEEGQTPPPPPPTSLPEISTPPAPEETVAVPQPQTDPLPQDTDELAIPIPQQQKKSQKQPTKKDHQYTYRYIPKRQQRRQQPSPPDSSNNPFANMETLNFNENPNKSRRKAATHRLPQGSRSGIDMSTGPLVKNGRINVPYAAKINIRGVNDAYGDAINAWIREHLYYPPDAAQNGEDGSASVHVSLNRDGYVLSVSLTSSSGSDTLDTAITGMFRGARLPRIPPDLPDHFELDLTINYILLRR